MYYIIGIFVGHLNRIGIDPIEYEYNEENPDPDMKGCIRYFDLVANAIL